MQYDNPFPGMNPYLERRDIWPDFHNRLIVAMAEELGPQLPDDYHIALQQRIEVAEPFDSQSGLALMIPDLLVTDEPAGPGRWATDMSTATVDAPPEDAIAVRVRMPREVRVTWLRIETVPERELVTIVEVLSPTNKAPGRERQRYIRKRDVIIAGGVNLVEIDLLRRWAPMPLETAPPASDYRILVCRGWERPDALLYPFSVQQPIPRFTLPLLPEDKPPDVDLGPIVNTLHQTARYGQITRYQNPPPEPEFEPETQQWVEERVAVFR